MSERVQHNGFRIGSIIFKMKSTYKRKYKYLNDCEQMERKKQTQHQIKIHNKFML